MIKWLLAFLSRPRCESCTRRINPRDEAARHGLCGECSDLWGWTEAAFKIIECDEPKWKDELTNDATENS